MRWIVPVVAVLLIGGSCGDDGESGDADETTTTTASTTTELGEATSSTSPVSPSSFSFATDDLCEWVDADTVSAIVAGAYSEHGATPAVTGFEESWGSDAYQGCSWSVEAPDPSDPRLSEIGLIRTEPLAEAISNGSVFVEHPVLSDGVWVNQAADMPVGGYGEFVCGMQVRLSVEGQDHTLEYWHCVPPDFDGDAYAVLSAADGLLREMGWVPVASDDHSTSDPTVAGPVYPWHAPGVAHTDPVDAVREFVDFVGFKQDAALGEFQQGDSRSGEVQIDPYPNMQEPKLPLTTAFVRLDASDNWMVIGAASGAVVVDAPVPDAVVSSPLATHFEYTNYGDGVVLGLWADGVAEPLVDEMLTSGGGVFAADVWDVTVEWSSEVTGPATAIFSSIEQPVGDLAGRPADERVDGVTAFRLELSS